MTETYLTIRLTEVATLRVVCVACGARIEVSIDRAAEGMRKTACPGCGKGLAEGMRDNEDPYRDFATALKDLTSFEKNFFVAMPIRQVPSGE